MNRGAESLNWLRSCSFVIKCADEHPNYPTPRNLSAQSAASPCPNDPTESDVSVDRGAVWGHETLDKGHACPLAGKSSMHSFPAIVLQPGAQISFVQVELLPSYSLSPPPNLSLTHFPL